MQEIGQLPGARLRAYLQEQVEIILQGLEVPGEPAWDFLELHAEQLLQHCREMADYARQSSRLGGAA